MSFLIGQRIRRLETNREPDTLSQNIYQGEFLASLTQELQEALDRINRTPNKSRIDLAILQNNADPKPAIIPTPKPRTPANEVESGK